METPVEFYEAQYRPPGGVWRRLGGKTLDGSRKAIEQARENARLVNRLIGEAETEYRIIHFRGTMEVLSEKGGSVTASMGLADKGG